MEEAKFASSSPMASAATRTCGVCSPRSTSSRFRIVHFDHVGSGSPTSARTIVRSTTLLHGYAHDMIEIIDKFADGPAMFVGHSVSAMIGMLADFATPARSSAT